MIAAVTLHDAVFVRAVDGDTIIVRASLAALLGGTDSWEHRVRIAGLRCPELSEPGGVEARGFTDSWCRGALELDVTSHGHDNYGRLVAAVTYRGASLADAVVAAGHGTRSSIRAQLSRPDDDR